MHLRKQKFIQAQWAEQFDFDSALIFAERVMICWLICFITKSELQGDVN